MVESSVQAQVLQQSAGPPAAADIVVGIPSYNNADTIGGVIRSAKGCLEKYFSSNKGIILLCDGGSKDGTREHALETGVPADVLFQAPYPAYAVHRLTTPYDGIPGKANAIQTIFQWTRKAGAKACAVLDASLTGVTPEWVRALLSPILDADHDFAAPCYQRHPYHGTITSSTVYPLTRALYGKRIRQPIGGDFGFSSRAVGHLLGQNVWNAEGARTGIDIWLVTQAVCGGLKVCQALLGARTHGPKYQAPDLSSTLAQVLDVAYNEMERYAAVWQRVRGSEATPTFGSPLEAPPEPAAVNVERIQQSFRIGFDTLQELWARVLTPASMLGLKRLAGGRGPQPFQFPDELWVRIVYDFALGRRTRVMATEHLLPAITPLYLGWLASFVLEMKDAPAAQLEDRLETLCLMYEEQKPYLISRWRWPDRFSP